MSQVKKILINVPETLLQEVDAQVLSEKGTTRSRLIRKAVRKYIKDKKKAELRKQMEIGYREMAEINLRLAEICFPADCQQTACYEENLAESD